MILNIHSKKFAFKTEKWIPTQNKSKMNPNSSLNIFDSLYWSFANVNEIFFQENIQKYYPPKKKSKQKISLTKIKFRTLSAGVNKKSARCIKKKISSDFPSVA